MKALNLRIFRRTKDNTAFLFNKQAVDNLQDLKVYNVSGTTKNELNYIKDIDDKLDSVQLVIDHAVNNLDPFETYVLSFQFDSTTNFNIKVYPAETFPDFEKDDKKQNTHLHGWVPSEKKWKKIELVKCEDGSYAIPVKVIK